MSTATTSCMPSPAAMRVSVGRIGRIRENGNAILPNATSFDFNVLQQGRENREDFPQLHTCAGAAHTPGKQRIAEIPPNSPDPPADGATASLWTAFLNKEDIFAMAYRLALPPEEPVDAWRLAVLNIARSEAFIRAVPQDVPLTLDDWERWKALDASPRKLLSLLRKLIYGVRIWD